MRNRFSMQRELIYDTIVSTTEHPTAEMVYNRLKPKYKNLSLGTVYRNLSKLSEDGKLSRFTIDGNVVRYDGDTKPHYHSVCVECGEISDIDIYVDSINSQFADKIYGKVLSHNIVFNIICPYCGIKN